MEEHLLKERLRELIGTGRVKAAVFYTFNFDPSFFENYVMPLLVPQQNFVNDAITNNIIWRGLYKQLKVPAITVYVDQYAKSVEAGPMLPYHIISVSMPSLGKNKGNFHPKQSFILLENQRGEEELIVITGSNNITQAGWCQNRECISEHVLINNKHFPQEFKLSLLDFVSGIAEQFNPANNNYSEAEELLLQFLKKKGTTQDKNFVFYSSYHMPFTQFLQEEVLFGDKTVREVEIITPYFKADTALVRFLTENGIRVKMEAPFKMGYCLLQPSLYAAYKQAGVRWYAPGHERMVHSKIYRFYGEATTYTIIGSVNFTAPAWCGVPEGKMSEVYNIESAILYVEKKLPQKRILGKEIKDEVEFLERADDLENIFTERLTAPPLLFTINWAERKLYWKGKLTNACELVLTDSIRITLSNKGEQDLLQLPHSTQIINSLSRHTLLQVVENVGQQTLTHYYYPQQEGFEQKPLEYRLSATDILDAWVQLGVEKEEELNEWLLTRLEVFTDLAQDESGKLIKEVSTTKSLLNEMARHLYGLIALEEFLFNPKTLKKSNTQLRAHGRELAHYLLHDNVLTLKSYLQDLESLYAEEKLLAGYYWLILSILEAKFYKNALLPKLIKFCYETEKEKKELRTGIEKILRELLEKQKMLEEKMGVERKKLKWASEALSLDYATVG